MLVNKQKYSLKSTVGNRAQLVTGFVVGQSVRRQFNVSLSVYNKGVCCSYKSHRSGLNLFL